MPGPVAVLALVGVVVGLRIMLRNNAVLRYRLALLRRIAAAAQADIAVGRFDWQWRYDEFREVSYSRMVLSLRPLTTSSWYPRDPARGER